MSDLDIMPFNSPSGGHCRVRHFPLNASAAFKRGEVVRINADGEVTEAPAVVTNDNVVGIAAATGDTTGDIDWRTGTTITTGALIPVYMPDSNQDFITSNYSDAGTAFGDAAPDAANIGQEVGLVPIGGVWGVELVFGTNANTARIVDVLDAQKRSVTQSDAGTGVFVVFTILAHQMAPDAGLANAPAA